MRGGALAAERRVAVEAIEELPIAYAWCWERHAKAGEYCAEAVCINHAATSDGLVLILEDDLTPITQKEYEAAGRAHAPRFIFLKDGAAQTEAASRFVRRQQRQAITRNFRNASELRTFILEALSFHAVTSARQLQLDRARARRPRVRVRFSRRRAS